MKRFVVLLTVVFFICSVAGSLFAEGQQETGKELHVGVADEPFDLDPAIVSDTGSGYLVENIYDPLVEIDQSKKLTTEYAVCSGWEWKEQNKGIVLDIRKGITFHDGTKLTAEDVKYNFDWILDPENNAPFKGLIGPVSAVNILDDYTLEVLFTEPYPTALENWYRALSGIVPKGSHGARTEEKGTSGLRGTELSRNPVGSGPFKFVEWVSGSHIVLEKNDDYWVEGIPAVDKVVFDFITDDAAKLSALISGSVDIVDQVPFRNFEQMQQNPNINTKRMPGTLTEIIYINLNSPPFGVSAEQNNDPEAIEKAYNLRKFLFHAIDREEIAEEIFYGMASLQYGPWYTDSEWISPKLKGQPLHDKDLAREYLAKAGYPNGGFNFRMMATNAQWFVDIATIIQAQLREYGVDVEVIPLDKSAFFDTMYETTEWDTGMEDWDLQNFSPLTWLFSGFYRNNHNHNNWRHASPDLEEQFHATVPGHKEFVELYDKASTETDKEKQKELVFEMQEITTEKVIQIDMMFLDNVFAWRKNVKGYERGLNQDGDINLRYVSGLE